MKDYYYDDEKIDVKSELRTARHHFESVVVLEEAAFEMLLLHPGCNKRMFGEILIDQYEAEVYDVYFCLDDEDESIANMLCKLWETLYYDKASGEEHTFKEWAIMFRTKQDVDNYYKIIKPVEM